MVLLADDLQAQYGSAFLVLETRTDPLFDSGRPEEEPDVCEDPKLTNKAHSHDRGHERR